MPNGIKRSSSTSRLIISHAGQPPAEVLARYMTTARFLGNYKQPTPTVTFTPPTPTSPAAVGIDRYQVRVTTRFFRSRRFLNQEATATIDRYLQSVKRNFFNNHGGGTAFRIDAGEAHNLGMGIQASPNFHFYTYGDSFLFG